MSDEDLHRQQTPKLAAQDPEANPPEYKKVINLLFKLRYLDSTVNAETVDVE
jgi:hypothetical protein